MRNDKSYDIGAHVTYVDEKGQQHDALVTTWWGLEHYKASGSEPGCNLVFVSADETKHDQYGRQTEHRTSVCHKGVQPAYGSLWCWPDEVAK